MNIKNLFLELTEYTIPNGMESEMEKFFPPDIQKDGCGNYFYKIGESKTIFTSHMDTSCYSYKKVNHVINGNMIGTDGSTVLSADDKAGMAIMLYMIYKRVPGVYYFFQGEESGMLGAQEILMKDEDFFKNYERMISFDRRATYSVITHQMGQRCCSEIFANALSNELNNFGLRYRPDPTGIFTDSATFMDTIPECTNLSVGYYKEHSVNETQDMAHLKKLANVACLIKWDKLPIGDKMEYRRYKKPSNSRHNNRYGDDYGWDGYLI